MSATSAARLAEVRAWSRVVRPGRSLWARLDTVYMVAIVSGTVGALVYGTASSALSKVATPEDVPAWGPSLLLVAMLLTLRWGTWQGPVVFAPADVGFLLGAPLPRRALALPRMVRGLAVGALAGALVAGIGIVGFAGRGRGIAAADAAGLVAGAVLCGLIAIAGAWWVQCSARAAHLVTRGTLPVVAVAAGLVVLARSGASGRAVVLWSGPWGWALQPVAGVPTGRWVAALVLLAVAAVAAVGSALRGAGRCSTERHAARAEARAGAGASLTMLDVRSAQLALRRVHATGRLARGGWLPRPRRPELAIPWRDATVLLRAPARLLEAVLLAGGATALAMTSARHAAVDGVAAFAIYIAAARLLEPLRLEIDAPATPRVLLRRDYGFVLLSHAIVPAAVLAVTAALVAIPCALAGVAPEQAGAVALVAVVAVPAITLCAALSARRGGQLPVSVLFAAGGADPTGGGIVIVAWVVAWPAAAAVIGGGTLRLAAHAGSAVTAVVAAVAAAAALALTLRATRD